MQSSKPSISGSSLADLIWDRLSVMNLSVGKREINIIISLLISNLQIALTQKKSVKIRGFGTFEIKKRKGRPNTRNPKTGILCAVRDRYAIVFKPSQKLKISLQDMDS